MKSTIVILSLIGLAVLTSQCKKNHTKSERCFLKPDAGECEAAIPKYYFNSDEGKCKVFLWGGCGGVVPFDSKEECEKACGCE